MKRVSSIGKMCAFCILCLVMVFSSTSCAKDEAAKNFNVLANDIKQLQNNFSNEIADGQTLIANTTAKDLADPNLLDQLIGKIDSEKQYSVVVPNVASDTAAINQQIQDLTAQKMELQKHYDALSSSVNAINESKQKLKNQIAADKEVKLQPDLKNYSTTWELKQPDGYKYSIMVTVWNPIPSESKGQVCHPLNSNEILSGYAAKKDIAIPLQIMIQNLTSSFTLESALTWPEIDGLLSNDTDFKAYLNSVLKPFDWIHFFSDGQRTTHWGIYMNERGLVVIKNNDTNIDNNSFISWSKVPPNGKSKVDSFIVIHDYFTPAFPNGNKGLLDNIAIRINNNYGFMLPTDTKKLLTLSGKVVNRE